MSWGGWAIQHLTEHLKSVEILDEVLACFWSPVTLTQQRWTQCWVTEDGGQSTQHFTEQVCWVSVGWNIGSCDQGFILTQWLGNPRHAATFEHCCVSSLKNWLVPQVASVLFSDLRCYFSGFSLDGFAAWRVDVSLLLTVFVKSVALARRCGFLLTGLGCHRFFIYASLVVLWFWGNFGNMLFGWDRQHMIIVVKYWSSGDCICTASMLSRNKVPEVKFQHQSTFKCMSCQCGRFPLAPFSLNGVSHCPVADLISFEFPDF